MIRSVLLAGLFAIIGLGGLGFVGLAYGQYLGNAEQVNANTIEENLALARAKVLAAEANPGSGSGTPIIDPDGVVGASVISGAIFGGIAATFFIRARSGKYAAQGRG